MKTALILSYHERPEQLIRTLKSIKSNEDFIVIIVDDNSPTRVFLPDTDYPIYYHKLTHKDWTNPDPVINAGIIHALRMDCETIIIQNAECMHRGDIISYANKNITDQNYISFACYSLSKESTQNIDSIDIDKLIEKNDICASTDGQDAWYNHPIKRPVAYEFCSAMTRNTIVKLNGFDERLSQGWGFGDNYFIARVQMLGLEITIPTDPMVLHQWHYSGEDIHTNKNVAYLMEKNRRLYETLVEEVEPKAVHIQTPDFDDIINSYKTP